MMSNFDFYFGIGGIVTYKNSEVADTIKHIGLNKIVLETDSPYLPPVPHRGKRNESSYIVHTAEKVASVFQTSVEDVATITTTNALKLFGISI
ncbi:MAG: hypothetical protein HC906_17795 [Bacteroidales bacterium]|nr:hypothetical protein [Bacteroidales bacterium]